MTPYRGRPPGDEILQHLETRPGYIFKVPEKPSVNFTLSELGTVLSDKQFLAHAGEVIIQVGGRIFRYYKKVPGGYAWMFSHSENLHDQIVFDKTGHLVRFPRNIRGTKI